MHPHEIPIERIPAAAEMFADKRNMGNPELDALFPFRLVSFEKPLQQRRARDGQVKLMDIDSRRQRQQFVAEHVLSFRREVADFYDQVIAQKSAVQRKRFAEAAIASTGYAR